MYLQLTHRRQYAYSRRNEDVRVRNLCGESETTYAYNTNGKLSQLLVKTTDGIVTKYVYGLGLIGEETSGSFKTYHFDYRGSTAAITDINGNVTDTFEYDTYGNLVSRTGTSAVIFLYNGRDGVVTDSNGLIYMRARYYSPELKRFINADIIAGEISNAVTLNRYAYANGNPVSNIDPFGLSAERGNSINYHAIPRNDINGIGMLSDGTILFGINATHEDVYALILISQMTFSGESSERILDFVDRYIDSRDGNTVIKQGKLLDYYTNFQDITKPLTALMIRNEYMYTTYYSGSELQSLANIPFAWITKLSEFKNNVQNKGIWDLKQKDDWQQSSLYYFDGELVDSDAPGNIMYGYMGKA